VGNIARLVSNFLSLVARVSFVVFMAAMMWLFIFFYIHIYFFDLRKQPLFDWHEIFRHSKSSTGLMHFEPDDPPPIFFWVGVGSFFFMFIRILISNQKSNIVKTFNLFAAVSVICIAIFVFSDACMSYGIIPSFRNDTSQVKDKLTCLYFSIVTWTTLGYGDFRPTDDLRLISAAEAILGYLSMAILVAAIYDVIRSQANPKKDDS
jgi:Ion channel